ncbi:MAG TPA: 4-hydroxy-3-methylbut-2-enyl diphosphate reductase [Thermodesulfobacteriota bacterium]|nr:4-hydroxy-3-methylbut-2-enyl diphosphate reductase [Thermodesulfobacteriota bacterium]
MEILIAKSAGFCFGVKRAINIAKKSADDVRGEISTLGPIIHNPQVVKKLEDSANIRPRKTLEEIQGGTIIIRSHGVKLKEFAAAKEKGLNIVDATCPFVKKTQELVSDLTKEGYTVIVVGDREHPEVQGIISYGNPDIIVAASVDEIKDLPKREKIGIVAQTTQSQERLQKIADFCLTRASEVKVCNTICSATSVRQEESVEISKEVECMIVIGGKNSGNTRRLFEVCRSIQPKTYHIEEAREIDPAWFKGIERLGVTAGASTPKWIIEEVISRLEELA